MSGMNGHHYNTFMCPHCKIELNPGNGPIIKMRGRLDAPTFSVSTDVFLPSGLGVYGRLTATSVELGEGTKIQFACPDCKEPFSETDEDDLAQILMRDEAGKEYMVSFNKLFGKRSTFVIDPQGRNVEREFGDDAETYREDLDRDLNWFGS